MRRFLALTLLGFALGSTPGTLHGVMQNAASVPLAPASAPYDQLPERFATFTARLGTVFETGEYVPPPTAVAVDGAGRVYSLTEGGAEIFVFNASGSLAGKIPQRTTGGASMVNPVAIGVSGDTLWVLDQGGARSSHFSIPSGAFLGARSTADGTAARGQDQELRHPTGERWVVESTAGGRVHYRVVSSDGRSAFRVSLPTSFVLMAAEETMLWGRRTEPGVGDQLAGFGVMRLGNPKPNLTR